MSTRLELWQVTGAPAPTPTANFVGDPGPGAYYVGGAIGPGNTTINAMDNNLWWPGDSQVSVVHNYSSNGNGIATTQLDEAIARGFIPSQSIKIPNQTPAQIVAGNHDAGIDTMAAACIARAPHPIWLCYYHEPEDNITSSTDKATFRAASRRIVTRMRTAGVTNVAWMPIYMNPYTFSSGSGRDWRTWHPDWTGTTWDDTLTMDMLGMDTYDPLPFTGTWSTATRNHYEFSELWASALAKIELAGTPEWDYVIPEFGMSNAFATDPDWLAWCTDARAFALAHRIKAFVQWDNSADTGRYSYTPTADPGGTKLPGWQHIVAGSTKWSLAA